MADHNEIDTHPAWEDGLGFGLGVLIVLTPYLTGDAVNQTVQLATTFLGLLVMFAAFTERLQVIDLDGGQQPMRTPDGMSRVCRPSDGGS